MTSVKKASPRGPRRPIDPATGDPPRPVSPPLEDDPGRPTLVDPPALDPPAADGSDLLEPARAETSDEPVQGEPGQSEESEPPGDEAGDPEAEAPVEIEHARLLPRVHLRGLLEALVFASDKPVTSHELAKMASAPLRDVKELMGELKATYAQRGIVLGEVAGGWLFRTSVQFAPFVRELTSERPVRLSRAQLETLAIAAYRQPITRPEIDEIRGVDSGATLKLLLERDLLRILGKKDEPGRPLLYGTTTQFLEFFGLKSLKDLPTLREFAELSDESRRVAEAELGDILPDARGHAIEPAPEPVPETPAPSEAAPPRDTLDDTRSEPAPEEESAGPDDTSITDPESVLGQTKSESP